MRHSLCKERLAECPLPLQPTPSNISCGSERSLQPTYTAFRSQLALSTHGDGLTSLRKSLGPKWPKSYLPPKAKIMPQFNARAIFLDLVKVKQINQALSVYNSRGIQSPSECYRKRQLRTQGFWINYIGSQLRFII